ncbi:MAG: Crp/Fnr family transcriptional regulator [Pedobacter sp.]|nr:MAG: Crp/Fnr family transcriptional regulator [Pedobacter sp.]
MSVEQFTAALGVLYPISNDYRSFLETEGVVVRKTIRKNDMLLMPGLDTGRLIYLPSGSCKIYWLDGDNEEHIFMFLESGSFLVIPDDFCIGQRNGDLYIKMIADSEVMMIGADQMREVYSRFPEAFVHVRMIEKGLFALRDKHLLMLMKKVHERYGYFVREFHYVYRMALTERELCRFLNICRKTLSVGKTNWLLKDRRR